MLTNYHTHTTRCGHAEGTEEEYVCSKLIRWQKKSVIRW